MAKSITGVCATLGVTTLGLATFSLATMVACAAAADLPKAMQKVVADLKLDAKDLDGLDQELAVPRAWIDGAQAEKETIVLGTWNEKEFRQMVGPFRERYPFINLKYDRSGTSNRGMKVLVALAENRIIADVLVSIADAATEFRETKALADLRELPGFKNIDTAYVAADGTWTGFKLSYRCMAYNTDKVKAADLPKTWDDLVNNPRWGKGNLALSNHPDSWLLGMWGEKGEAWGVDFTQKLFRNLQPQRRKEGMTAVSSLTVAGEFDANIPAPEWVVKRYVTKGAPINYHCPEPVPINISQIAMLDKSPRKNAARLFINWMISREGQIMQYAESFAVPVHKALQSEQYRPFGETITGKPAIVRDETLLNGEASKKMNEVWDAEWAKAPAVGKGQ